MEMSQTLKTAAGPAARMRTWRMPALMGTAAAVVAAAIAVYGAYGDPHPKSSQESGVPFLVIVDLAVAALLFGLVVPRALRSGSVRWGLVPSILALVGVLAFWSGVPFVVGAAGALIAAQGRQRARDNGARAGGHTAALVLGAVAMAAGVAFTVLGNTVLASH
jgi:hypothetical protein